MGAKTRSRFPGGDTRLVYAPKNAAPTAYLPPTKNSLSFPSFLKT
jgi:hypothetical protein